MIDYFSIALTHVLIAIAAFRMLSRDDLDDDGVEDGENTPKRPWLKNRPPWLDNRTPDDG